MSRDTLLDIKIKCICMYYSQHLLAYEAKIKISAKLSQRDNTVDMVLVMLVTNVGLIQKPHIVSQTLLGVIS